jgi:hypothetical protein
MSLVAVMRAGKCAPAFVGAVALASLGACVAPRMHTEAELADVTRACGLGAGELIQDTEEPKILFLIHPNATPRERLCAIRWAKRNHLHLAYVEGIELKDK